jgi:heat shock protein HtpX
MAVSRAREYAADRDGARIAQNPRALASALATLQRGAEARPMRQASEATSHMFIVHPFTGGLSGLKKLFSTHPPTQERIDRLNEMAREGAY